VTLLVAVLAAVAGVVGAAGLWWSLLRTGRYRSDADQPALSLARSWITIPAAGLVAAALGARLPGSLLAAGIVYAVAGPALAWIDVDVHRVPDRILAWLAPALAVAVSAAAAITGTPAVLVSAVAGAVGLGVLYLALALVGSMGLGDVKLAATSGILLGAAGWHTSIAGAVFGFVAAGIFAVLLLITRRADRRSHLPVGPAIILGAVVALIA